MPGRSFPGPNNAYRLHAKLKSGIFRVAMLPNRNPRTVFWCGTSIAWLLVVVSLPAADAKVDGKILFEKNCAPCHGKDGKAKTPAGKMLGVKDLTLSKLPDAEIERQIVEGRKDDQGTQKMPPFKDKLTDEEIKALVRIVKGLRK
jgi:mono/diheme cytochrome c family protein